MSFDVATLRAAHKHCAAHRSEVQASDMCGCFSCVSTFPPSFIDRWIEETGGELAKRPDPWTALCPECDIDAVIGSKSGYPVHDLAFLKAMNGEWFGEVDAQN
ncbi:cytoplasmic protein [Sphingomonas donggukensis]|uniref:Cytoplasmic protein n=1 Tax=Sphingomonas donggukensis TaxID=2949093 RepID=A0ABY4TQM2_9SPHN|nr:cytoplasmic protein [Sphingomonas donggukensis]URW74512.1 cytoplasmic protein [Sphingomonas donggukensis]